MVVLNDGISPIRVASVPAGHPYVRHLSPPDRSDPVLRLPDPTEPWWPPLMLDPHWVRSHPADFDLMHVHFGYDGVDPADLDALGVALEESGKPLVVTVHDLRNPHHVEPALHGCQLGALLRHATEVVTLTRHAAGEIRERFGRCAEVIPHPHIVELGEMRRRQSLDRPTSTVIGLHFKSLRANMVTTELVDAVVQGVRRVPGAELRVDVHLDVAEVDGARHDPVLMARLHELEAAGDLHLSTHDYFDDDGFVDYLASLRASVLPYRFGTHSGWLEACRDLGVAVVAPDCGAYHDQGPVFGYVCNERDGLDPQSCADAVEAALVADRPRPVSWRERHAQRRQIADAHLDVYRRALQSVGRRTASSS